MSDTEAAAARRLARAREGFADRGLDGLLVTHLPNLRYLTGFSGSNGWLLLLADRAVLFTDGRYEEQAVQEVPADAGVELQVPREKLLSQLAKLVSRELGGTPVGFEGSHLSYDDWQRLREEAESVKWSPVAGVVEKLRAVKDAEELVAMEKAAEIAAGALLETLADVALGREEADIAAELDYRMTRLGSERPAFETIVASGERTALPHAATSRRKLEQGDLLLIDFGARCGGYCSDITRTFCVGDPTPRQLEVYDAVLSAQRQACAALTTGVQAGDVDAAAREVFRERGVEEYFVHSTGHGLGLEVHEGPALRRNGEETLGAGMVVTVEPGLYFPGWGGVRIEDDLLVGEGEPRPLVELEKARLLTLPF
ncbi:MAG TPA: Xaa-Pro peptidase family protein [Gemmatimonadota bacterium]|nr:Xaa-Pro peptidase family protein [Gemmatimonadota bacterium]